jgi:hypothetical protein
MKGGKDVTVVKCNADMCKYNRGGLCSLGEISLVTVLGDEEKVSDFNDCTSFEINEIVEAGDG